MHYKTATDDGGVELLPTAKEALDAVKKKINGLHGKGSTKRLLNVRWQEPLREHTCVRNLWLPEGFRIYTR